VKLQFKKRRLIPVALAILVLVVGSGVAYAYWSSTGGGIGTANAAAGTIPVTVNQTPLIGMYPGQTQTLSGTFNNPNAGQVYVAAVTVAFDATTPVNLNGNPGPCAPSNFTLGGTATVNAEVLPGTPQGSWTGLTITFNDTAGNQDGCKGATVNLVYTAS
jgi:hypothetical protein